MTVPLNTRPNAKNCSPLGVGNSLTMLIISGPDASQARIASTVGPYNEPL